MDTINFCCTIAPTTAAVPLGLEIWIDDQIEHSTIQNYITEAGDVEKWTGSVKNKLLESKEETIKYLQSLKKD